MKICKTVIEENYEKEDNFKKGKECELKFKKLLNDFNCYSVKIPDCHSTGSFSRSPCDFLVTYQGFSLLFEIKWTKELNKFNLNRITEHQFINLQKHRLLGKGRSFVVIYNPKGMFIIDFKLITHLKVMKNISSINLVEMMKYNVSIEDILN